MILEYIEIEGSITNKNVQDLCGYDERKARYNLDKMKQEGIIVLMSKGRNSYYVKTDNKPTINRQLFVKVLDESNFENQDLQINES